MEDVILKELQELKDLTLIGTKKALSMNETSKLMGVSKSHLYKLVCAKKIPFYKAKDGGKLTYFNKAEIETWLLHHRFKTKDEIETEAVNYIVTRKKGGKIERL